MSRFVRERHLSTHNEQMPDAFEAFYRAHYERVRSIVRGILWKVAPDSVEEVVHDAFFRVYEVISDNRHTLGDSSLPFIRVIAQRRALDVLRRMKLRTAVPFDDERHGALDEPLDVLMWRVQMGELFAKTVMGLGPTHREVLNGLLGCGSHAEAAASLGISRGVLKVRLHRAQRALREELGKRGIHLGN